MSLYAQDQWTINRLSLNLGLRYDYFNTSVPAQDVPASRFVPAQHYDAVGQVLGYEISPRIRASYDLFGTGRTAVKASINRYVNLEGVNSSLTNAMNPVTASVLTASRSWNDGNRDFVPDCDFANPLANNECGPLSDQNFGRINPRATQVDPELLTGWGTRAYNWEVGAGVQHELAKGLALSVNYARRWFERR